MDTPPACCGVIHSYNYFMGHIILGLVITAIGVFMTVKTEFMLRVFGRLAFFERHLGPDGGSRLGYKLLGMAVIFIGIIIMTNMIGSFLTWLLSPLLRFNQPPQI